MSYKVSLDTLRSFLDAFNQHDLDAIMDFFAEDCVFYIGDYQKPGANIDPSRQYRKLIYLACQ